MTQQELIDALANGGTIQLGDETIVIDTNLVISQDGTRLLGNGWDNSVIDFKPGIGMHISANDIIVEDIHFTNTFLADGAEQHSLEVNGGYENIHINKVKVSNGDDAGIRIGYRWSGSQNTRVAASHCQITNCELKNINEGSGIEVMSASHVLIANNKISGCTQSGIRIAGGSHCKIHNNEIDNINESGARYHGGIYAVGGGSRKFWDYIRHIDIKGNKITTDSKGIIIGTQTEHVSIDCNEIILTNEVDSTGIYLTSSHNDAEFGYRNISISSNLIKGVLANGIELHTRDNQPFVSGQNVSILKNIIKGFHGTGINVRGNNIGEVLDIYIRDNAFQKVDIPNTQFVTITECDDIYIGDNLKSTSIDEDEIFLRNNAVIEFEG